MVKDQLLFLLDYYKILENRDENSASNKFYQKLDTFTQLEDVDNNTAIFLKTLFKLCRECGSNENCQQFLSNFLKINDKLILSNFKKG